METPVPIRARILDAAEVRFRQFGYNKTTMAEIAADCDMSAANLYRYFENKLDIGANLSDRCLAEEERRLRTITECKDLSSAAQLEQFILAVLHRTHELWSEQPRISEMVEAITGQRKALVVRHMESKQSMLRRLLEHGNRSGEFAVMDPGATAEAIRVAITLLDIPTFMHLYPLQEFERLAKNVVQLILLGVLKR